MNKMTVLLVALSFVAIAVASFVIWYVPYKEANNKELEKRETGKFAKRIAFHTPMLCCGDACFVIVGADHTPLITNGKGDGKLYVPNERGKGEGILFTWIDDKMMKISLTIYDENQSIVSLINGNEWTVNKSARIDCNYDLENFEVVTIENEVVRPVLQIQLKSDRVNIAFETYLNDGTSFFWGNNRLGFSKKGQGKVFNDLKPFFKYPSSSNFGRLNETNQ
jgi:hypothetical protein